MRSLKELEHHLSVYHGNRPLLDRVFSKFAVHPPKVFRIRLMHSTTTRYDSCQRSSTLRYGPIYSQPNGYMKPIHLISGRAPLGSVILAWKAVKPIERFNFFIRLLGVDVQRKGTLGLLSLASRNMQFEGLVLLLLGTWLL